MRTVRTPTQVGPVGAIGSVAARSLEGKHRTSQVIPPGRSPKAHPPRELRLPGRRLTQPDNPLAYGAAGQGPFRRRVKSQCPLEQSSAAARRLRWRLAAVIVQDGQPSARCVLSLALGLIRCCCSRVRPVLADFGDCDVCSRRFGLRNCDVR
jgi:hypothetical protein